MTLASAPRLERCHTLRIHDPDSIEGAMAAAVGPDGLIAGLRALRAAGKIENVSFGMNANLDHLVITPGAGGADRAYCPIATSQCSANTSH